MRCGWGCKHSRYSVCGGGGGEKEKGGGGQPRSVAIGVSKEVSLWQ